MIFRSHELVLPSAMSTDRSKRSQHGRRETTHAIRKHLQFDRVVCALQGDTVHEGADGAAGVLPAGVSDAIRSRLSLAKGPLGAAKQRRAKTTHHDAAVKRGSRSFSAILLSSIWISDRCPGLSYHSTEEAERVSTSTSPPKYRDRSPRCQLWVERCNEQREGRVASERGVGPTYRRGCPAR